MSRLGLGMPCPERAMQFFGHGQLKFRFHPDTTGTYLFQNVGSCWDPAGLATWGVHL